MSNKIYDKDIELWTATVENHNRQLYSCSPEKEYEFRLKKVAAENVLFAIKRYKALHEQH